MNIGETADARRRRNAAIFRIFQNQIDDITNRLKPSSPRFETLAHLYAFFTLTGDTKSGSRGRWVRVAFGSRPYDSYRDVEMRQMKDGSVIPIAVTGLNAEVGPALEYLIIPNGSVLVLLFPANRREMPSKEGGLILDIRLDASALHRDRVLRAHWKALMDYGVVTSFGIAPSAFERARVWWLRQSRWHIGEDTPPAIYKALWGIAKIIPQAARLFGGYMWPSS